MKAIYKEVEYEILKKEDGRVYMIDGEGNEKDIAESTFEKAEIIEDDPVKEKEPVLTPREIKKQQQDYLREKVAFKAIYDGEKYKDDITVTVNGKNYVIKRGVRVMIPRFVYNALEAHERQRTAAAHTSSKYNKEYKDKEDTYVY